MYRFRKWGLTHRHSFGKVLSSQRISELLGNITEDAKMVFFKRQACAGQNGNIWLSTRPLSRLIRNSSSRQSTGRIKRVTSCRKSIWDCSTARSHVCRYTTGRWRATRWMSWPSRISWKTSTSWKWRNSASWWTAVSLVSGTSMTSWNITTSSLSEHGATWNWFGNTWIRSAANLLLTGRILMRTSASMRRHSQRNGGLYWEEGSHRRSNPQQETSLPAPLLQSTVLCRWTTQFHVSAHASPAGAPDWEACCLPRKGIRKIFYLPRDAEARPVCYSEGRSHPRTEEGFRLLCLIERWGKRSGFRYQIYRNKDLIEKSFGNLKERLDMRRMSVASEENFEGKLFIQFIALMYLVLAYK